MEPQTITSRLFLEHFCDNDRADKRFCFILGAGASRNSGIPTGAELVKVWYADLQKRYSEEQLTSWIDSEEINVNDLAASYSRIYDKRYELNKKDGYAFLETQMEGKEPSCGYAALAWIMGNTRNNIVITTNFDSLTEDALFIYTQKKPLVVGHESLAQFINPNTSRPLIVKIHRDIFLSPKNSENEIDAMDKGFAEGLKAVFKNYTPIVIGYGGNDGSLMGFLEWIEPAEGGMFWCYRQPDGMPSEKIQNVLNKHKGHFVAVKSFDDLMIQIGDRLKVPTQDESVIELAKKRAETYQSQIQRIRKSENRDEETEKALSNIIERREKKDWWYYEQLATEQKTVDERDSVYRTGIELIPDSSELLNNYALFLKDEKKDMVRAEEYYEKALKSDPNNAIILSNYALFLQNEKKDMERTEEYYEKALKADLNNATILGNYAFFLQNEKKDMERAEEYYEKALKADPNNANILGDYALLLQNKKKNLPKAEEYYEKALKLDPNKANNLGNYANFLWMEKKDIAGAEEYYQKALKADPNNANNLGNYAAFLGDEKKDIAGAEEYFQKALKANPNHANHLGNYAKFLIEQDNFDQSSLYLKQAFKHNSGRDDLELELWFYAYAVFYGEYPESREKIENLLSKDVRSPGWNLKGVLETAKKHGHPDFEKLCEFERLITAETES